ncbi:MAG: hypothetical protein EOQ69_09530 [Mesorhizobium sp.]|nr:MAG: hypothetical protein EOQ69_09530 [Mesorhizobium sp.]
MTWLKSSKKLYRSRTYVPGAAQIAFKPPAASDRSAATSRLEWRVNHSTQAGHQEPYATVAFFAIRVDLCHIPRSSALS